MTYKFYSRCYVCIYTCIKYRNGSSTKKFFLFIYLMSVIIIARHQVNFTADNMEGKFFFYSNTNHTNYTRRWKQRKLPVLISVEKIILPISIYRSQSNDLNRMKKVLTKLAESDSRKTSPLKHFKKNFHNICNKNLKQFR